MCTLLALALVAGCTNEVGITCPTGQTLCGNQCTFGQLDPNNCGACGTVCPMGEVCSQGLCSATCATGLTNCNRACVDVQTDLANCGACGTGCASGQSCIAGVCVTTCPMGQTLCNNLCVNLSNDPNHCGACGGMCPANHFCVLGVCILGCPPPLLRCLPDGGASDAGTQCVDPLHDPRNCGGCGGEHRPASPSPSPQRICPSVAANHTLPTCEEGRCTLVCESSFLDCTPQLNRERSIEPLSHAQPSFDPDVGGPFCIDPDFDNCNCGGCGLNLSCFGHDDGFACVYFCGTPSQLCCSGDIDTLTTINQDDSCGSSCANLTNCTTTGRTCCSLNNGTGSACSNLVTDLRNCGSCGNDCTDDGAGFAGCCPQPSGPPAFCVDLNRSDGNCGGCGIQCNSNPSLPPLTSCCPSVSPRPGGPSGGCTNLATDLRNCGQCGNDCVALCPPPSPSPVCFGGTTCLCGNPS